MTLRVALIGAGAMGSNHARTIDASPRSELALIVDRDQSRARDLAVAHGTNCEDGSLQGICQATGLPQVGCDVLSSASSFNSASY